MSTLRERVEGLVATLRSDIERLRRTGYTIAADLITGYADSLAAALVAEGQGAFDHNLAWHKGFEAGRATAPDAPTSHPADRPIASAAAPSLDKEGLCGAIGYPEAGRKMCELLTGHSGYHRQGDVCWLGFKDSK